MARFIEITDQDGLRHLLNVEYILRVSPDDGAKGTFVTLVSSAGVETFILNEGYTDFVVRLQREVGRR